MAMARTKTPRADSKRAILRLAAALIATILVLLVGSYAYRSYTKLSPTTVTIARVAWSYSQPLKDYLLRHRTYATLDSTWRPEITDPSLRKERIVYRYKTVRREFSLPTDCVATEAADQCEVTRVVYDKVPVYGTRWTWDEMAWEPADPLIASGEDYNVSIPGFVPDGNLQEDGPPLTTFSITFTYVDEAGEPQEKTREYPREVWVLTALGEQYDALVDELNNLRAVKGLDPEYDDLMK